MNMSEQKYDKPYEVNGKSTIFFGKFKGQPHSVLLDPSNKSYVDWILDTEDDFATSTKVYLRNFELSKKTKE
jgi:hypothetical protein